MRLLCILFVNWLIISVYDHSIFAAILCIVLGVTDYLYVYFTVRYFKNRSYKEIISSKTKILSLSLNIVLTILCAFLMYDQYLRPDCQNIDAQFNKSLLMRDESFAIGKKSKVLPRSMKACLIQISDVLEWSVESVTALEELNDATIPDSEKAKLLSEMKSAMKQKEACMTENKQMLQKHITVIIVLLLLNLIRRILWYWTNIAFLFKRILERSGLKVVN